MLTVVDALRGLAALFVVLHHGFQFLWSGPDLTAALEGGSLPAWVAVALNPLRFGRQAVMLFFILSGFCIHYRQALSLAQAGRGVPPPAPSWRTFAFRRLRRLYPTLLFALSLTVVVDSLGATLNPTLYADPHAWPEQIQSGLNIAPITAGVVVANLLMQADVWQPHLGSNGPLWSLAYEFWFYVLYPVVYWLSARFGHGRMLRTLIAAAAIGLLLASWSPSPLAWWIGKLAVYWGVWGAGAAIAEAFVRQSRPRLLVWAGPVTLLAVLGALFLGQPGDLIFHDLVWSTGIALVFAYLMLAAPKSVASGATSVSRFVEPLSRVSYSLYATHFPPMILIAAWWLSFHDSLPASPLLAILGVAVSIPVAALSWFLVERWTAPLPSRQESQMLSASQTKTLSTRRLGEIVASRLRPHRNWRPAIAAFFVALAVLAPAASGAAPHVDEAQYLWSAAYFTRKVVAFDVTSRGSHELNDPGWAPESYWALTQPMGTRLLYGSLMVAAGAAIPDLPFTAPDAGERPAESPIPAETLRLTRALAVLIAATAFSLFGLRWGWLGAAGTLSLLVPHVRDDLAHAWAEGPLLLGFALAAVTWRTRWFPYVCGVAATLKLTALILWPLVFFKHPLGHTRFARVIGLAVPAVVWTALTPTSWQFGGPFYLGAMLVNRVREQAHMSTVFGGPAGFFFPSRYALPLEFACAAVVVWLLRHRLVHVVHLITVKKDRALRLVQQLVAKRESLGHRLADQNQVVSPLR